MRRLLVWVPEGAGAEVRETARRHGVTDLVSFSGEDGDGSVDLVLLHVPNRQVGDLLDALRAVDALHVSMFPHGALNLKPPPGEAPSQVKDVTLRSPLEIFLGGLQSVGSWAGFLGYAAASGLVVWVGLYTNTVYLLTAAMLIAPFAGPAMNAAVATARGDAGLLGRGLGRYLAGLALAVATAGLMSLLFDQRIATTQMAQTASISTAAVVLPLVAGAAGAINLSQSERSSLVSGAATGMLVAAALAPPAGLVGMSVVIGEWDMAKSGLFLLGLQLVGINLSGAAVFRLVGLKPAGSRYSRGRGWVQKVSLLATLLALGGFLLWQFGDAPELQRATLAQRAEATAQEVVSADGYARPVRISAGFSQSDIPGQNPLLVTAYVERTPSADRSAETLERDLRQRIGRELEREVPSATPLVDVTVLDAP
jgi:uncharacterized hydrophobic protein (TIGR00271 family)